MFYLISYDIQDDKARDKALKYLKDQGYHLQKSVFVAECKDRQKAVAIYRRLTKWVNAETDRILVVPICNDCIGKTMIYGNYPDFQKDVWIV